MSTGVSDAAVLPEGVALPAVAVAFDDLAMLEDGAALGDAAASGDAAAFGDAAMTADAAALADADSRAAGARARQAAIWT
jgi:hypothetical protein